jgi:hypothetical protein
MRPNNLTVCTGQAHWGVVRAQSSQWVQRIVSARPLNTFCKPRAVFLGLLIGCLLCFTNLYFGLQTGWISMYGIAI